MTPSPRQRIYKVHCLRPMFENHLQVTCCLLLTRIVCRASWHPCQLRNSYTCSMTHICILVPVQILLANSDAWDLPIAAHRPQLCGKGTADELLAQRLQKKLNHLHGILANVTRFETAGDPRQCVCITVHKRSFRSLRCI